MSYQAGDLLQDRYKIIKLIGEGAMGAVYKAEHCLMQKTVAIKVLHANTGAEAEFVQRFKREAQSASSIDHPNVCKVTDFAVTEEGEFFLVMEYLEGEALTDRLEKLKKLHPVSAVSIAVQVLSALQCAHDLGIVHRDIKLDNVFLVNKSGAGDFVKLLDFGISRNVTQENSGQNAARLTQAGLVYGTPQYLAPEQALGLPTVDYRCDIYSTGVVLFELLTGKPPFTGENLIQILNAHVSTPPPHLQSIDPKMIGAEQLDAILQKLLAKKPEDRYQSANEAIEDLNALEFLSNPKVLSSMANDVYGMKVEELSVSGMCPAILLSSQMGLSRIKLSVVTPSVSATPKKQGKSKVVVAVAAIAIVILVASIAVILFLQAYKKPQVNPRERIIPPYAQDLVLIPCINDGLPPLISDMKITKAEVTKDFVFRNDENMLAAIGKIENKNWDEAIDDFNRIRKTVDMFYKINYDNNPNFLKFSAYLHNQNGSFNVSFVYLEALFLICPDAFKDGIVFDLMLDIIRNATRPNNSEVRDKILNSNIVKNMSLGFAEKLADVVIRANVSPFRSREKLITQLLETSKLYDQLPEWKKLAIQLRLRDEKSNACAERKFYVDRLVQIPDAWVALEPYLRAKNNSCTTQVTEEKTKVKRDVVVNADCQACFRSLLEDKAKSVNNKNNEDNPSNS